MYKRHILSIVIVQNSLNGLDGELLLIRGRVLDEITGFVNFTEYRVSLVR